MDSELLLQIFVGSMIFLLGMIIHKITINSKLIEHKTIKKQAETDPLTGRGNRHKFIVDLEKRIRKGKKFAVCFMDLDGFKNVNDTLGHDAGDILLIELSNRLKSSLPDTTESYRLGGDEFSVLIDDVNTIEEISKILDKLKEGLSKEVVIGSNEIVLEYSLGVAIYPTDAITRQDLMTYADDAMYYIKENGKNNYYFHNAVLKSKLQNKKKMQEDLKKAIENSEFRLEYEPRIALNNSEQICLEALVYWQHPVLGKLDAEYFMTQAKEMGFIVQVDEFVFKNVCEKLKELNESNSNEFQIAINMSSAYTKRTDFINKLCDEIEAYKFKKGQLIIQFIDRIDVKSIANYKYLTQKLNKLGVKVSVNSFDIEYKKLSLFNELEIDEVKISVKFAADESKFNIATLKDIVNLSKDLKYDALVKGISTKVELEYALDAKANYLQGEYIYKPVAENEIETIIDSYIQTKENLLALTK